jgi:hypothetical protein
MGDYSDASFELFGDQRSIDVVVESFAELIHPEKDPSGAISYIAPDLRYGAETPICATLRDLGIAYEFFQMGDYEYEPQIRLFHPDVPERFGHESATGEWRGPATASGEPVLPVRAIDRIFEEMPHDADEVWLREALDVASGARWRGLLDRLRGRTPRTSTTRRGDRLARLLGENPTFTYVNERDRYLVLLAVSYGHDSDPTDTGERVASPRDAAHWALDLTRDGGSADTQWAVFDAELGRWTVLEQSDVEEA